MDTTFGYKPGNSFLHKIPAFIKILFIPIINIIFMFLPMYAVLTLVVIQFVMQICVRFSVKEIYLDLKPVIYYGILLYLFGFCGDFFSRLSEIGDSSLWEVFVVSLNRVFSNLITLEMLLKLFCIMQSASLIFKTSTMIEIREGIGKIEGFIRKVFHLKKTNRVTNSITLFINFIPMVTKIWNESKKAWIARQGKKNLRMYGTLLPVLFSIGMKKAYNTAKALTIRQAD